MNSLILTERFPPHIMLNENESLPGSGADNKPDQLSFDAEGQTFEISQRLALLLQDAADVRWDAIEAHLLQAYEDVQSGAYLGADGPVSSFADQQRRLEDRDRTLRDLEGMLVNSDRTLEGHATMRILNIQTTLRHALEVLESSQTPEEMRRQLWFLRIGVGLGYEETMAKLPPGSRENLLVDILRQTGLEQVIKQNQPGNITPDIRKRVEAAIAYAGTLLSPAESARLDQRQEESRRDRERRESRSIDNLSAAERTALLRDNRMPSFCTQHGMTEDQWLATVLVFQHPSLSHEEKVGQVLLCIPSALREALVGIMPSPGGEIDDWIYHLFVYQE